MEVHAHTHTPRKKWTHYFWEFLMLFLAVFCGFLAEYQLEHTIENQREKRYVSSLLAETRQDIIEFDKLLERIAIMDPVADSLYYNVSNAEKYNYNLVRKWNSQFTNTPIHYYPSLTTIQQLKFSGNLRLIKNQQLQQLIVLYDILVNGNLMRSRTAALQSLKVSFDLQNEFCNLADFNKSISLSNEGAQKGGESKQIGLFEMPIITRDKLSLNRFANSFVDFRGYLFFYKQDINKVKSSALNLIEMITKNYDLK